VNSPTAILSRPLWGMWVQGILAVATAIACCSPATSAAADTAPSDGLTRAPKLVHFVAAEWPADATPATAPVDILLQLDLDAAGAVAAVAVKQSGGTALDRVVTAAAQQFRFEPALWAGVPGPVRIVYRYRMTWRPPPTATLTGLVRDAATARGLVGATLSVLGLPAAATQTDSKGRFEWTGLPNGPVRIVVKASGYPDQQVTENLLLGARTEVRYTLSRQGPSADPGDDYEVVAKAPPLRRDPVAVRVDASEASRIPGAQGDVLKVVDSLGGVGRAAVGSAAVVVWGSALGESRTYLDGVPLPRLYHQGGLRSVLHPDVVGGLELLPGGYGPAWGRSLGAVVAVQTKEAHALLGPRGGVGRGSLSIDPLEGGARWSGWAGPVGVTVAGRLSWLDRVAAGLVPRAVQEVLPLPQYRDAQVRMDLYSDAETTVDLTWLHARDVVDRRVLRGDPSQTVLDLRRDGFDRLSLRWQRRHGSAAQTRWLLWGGRDIQMEQARVGTMATSLDRNTWRGGLRGEWRSALGPNLDLLAGLDAEVAVAAEMRSGSIANPPREGDLKVFGQLPSERVASDAWQVTQVGIAPWLALSWKLARGRLAVEPGLRLDPQIRNVSRRTPLVGNTPEIGLLAQQTSLEPRMQVRANPIGGWQLRAAWAVVSQPPDAADLTPVFGNPSLGPAAGRHTVVASEVGLPNAVTVEVAAFLLQSDGLAVRSAAQQPLLAQALLATGEGRSRGLQLSIKAQPSPRWLAWLAWTWSRAERRSNTTAAWRLSDYDQPHLLTAAVAYQPAAGWDVGLRLRLASGVPRTPVVGAWYDALRDRWQPLFGPLNQERLPPFVQADLRVARRWQGRAGWAEAYLELQNATARQNAEDYVYSPDFSWRDILRGLPILPLVGVKCGF
jgi:TonB family protein